MGTEKTINESTDLYSTDPSYEEYLTQLNGLREDGESKVIALKNEIKEYKLNKQLEKEERVNLIADDKTVLEAAKQVAGRHKGQVREIVKEASLKSTATWKPYYADICQKEKAKISDIKALYRTTLSDIKAEHSRKVGTIRTMTPGADMTEKELKEKKKIELKAEKIAFKAKKHEAASNKLDAIAQCKDAKYEAYMEKYGYISKIRNNKHSFGETIEFRIRHYAYLFKLRDFFIKNAMYFIIILFFLVCVFMDTTLLTNANNIIGILSQSSQKLFYTLGVAGLILLAGTDLSIGRMTGLGVCVVCMTVTNIPYTFNNGSAIFLNNPSAPAAVQIAIALIAVIIVCVVISSLAGFFTAKFKMHPFITTLSTQMLIFGIMMVLFSNTSAFNMYYQTRTTLLGPQNYLLIVYAVIATAIVWFIWNKTKFGKYMYAVGGNAEAAAVSGINVFAVTMGVFIMAGVLYGLGGFATALYIGSGNPNTGLGTELDAIAAAVIGGISFNGGIGKISGAVVGTIIFTGMTYCLTYLGFDPNIQYIFKAVIIMLAVCLDSIKYLKKK